MVKRKRLSIRDTPQKEDSLSAEIVSPSAAPTGQKKVRWEGNSEGEAEDVTDDEAESQISNAEKVSP